MSTQIEYTDTFGGEANYCWCRRWFCKEDLTDAQAIRLAKALADLTGHPCRKVEMGDTVALYPRDICQVVFVGYSESGFEKGTEVDRHGNDVELVEA